MFKLFNNIELDDLANLVVNITIILLIVALCFTSYLRLYHRLWKIFINKKLAFITSILIVNLGLIPILWVYYLIM